jgi:tetratricopeptide (TPR) repeat protein
MPVEISIIDPEERFNRVSDNPEDSAGWRELGFHLIGAKRYKEGLDALRESVRLAPDSYEPYQTLGMLCAQLGLAEEAIPALERVIELRPETIIAYVYLGIVQMRLGQHERAISAFSVAIERDPGGSAESFARIAACQFALGDPEGAEESLKMARKLDPEIVPENVSDSFGPGIIDRSLEQAGHR